MTRAASGQPPVASYTPQPRAYAPPAYAAPRFVPPSFAAPRSFAPSPSYQPPRQAYAAPAPSFRPAPSAPSRPTFGGHRR